MLIEHVVMIDADIRRVWDIFTDMTCWKQWSTVLGDSSSEHDRIAEGKRFTFCLRPFSFPVYVEPVVEEVVYGKRIVWSGAKHGIHARHEFIFTEEEKGVMLKSRENFNAGPVRSMLFHLPKKKLHSLSVRMLEELKAAAEKEEG